jgi:heme/copper-type cytochrome/quinol oxidase subunit 2
LRGACPDLDEERAIINTLLAMLAIVVVVAFLILLVWLGLRNDKSDSD